MDDIQNAEDARNAETLNGLTGGTGTGAVELSGRCGDCGYLLTSAGHEVTCGGAAICER